METPKEGHAFFCNRACEYFPCHPEADPERFNCLFCYCPLYVLGDRCGGDFRYSAGGNKDCTLCLFPHQPENYKAVLGRYREIVARMPHPGEKGRSE